MPKSVMKHQFSMVPKAEIPRSTFNRTHGHKTTFDAGYIVPFLIDEGLPGDTFSVSGTFFARLATPIHPFMDNMFMDVHWFAVPLRLLWDNWEKFNGAQDNPADSTDFTIPVTASYTPAENELSDYFGIVPGKAVQHNVLPLRGYNLIYNEWYRNQNLIDSITVNTDDGPDATPGTVYVLRKRNKRHDYFTSSLPWPQKGDSITIPLGTSAPIYGDNMDFDSVADAGNQAQVRDAAGAGANLRQLASDTATLYGHNASSGTGELKADLTNATASTINQLRQSFQIQKLLERDARGGTRYTEVVKSHFGVTSPDARMQRPEYLGGGTVQINVTPVQQTSSTDATTPQGNLAAYATAVGGNLGFTKSFTEHVYIYGLVSVRADLTYQQGLERMWSRSTRYDFYWPALAHIGEQAVLNKEIFYQNLAADDLVFGYQERNAEYRYKPSRISGKFRSDATGTLDPWHLSQDFAALPTLDQTFIEETPPVSRVVAVVSEPEFIFDSYIQMRCARPMPIYGVPGLIDHF